MSAHTPGPWEVDADDIEQGADNIFTVSIWAAGPDGDRPHVGTVNAFSLLSETRGGTEYVTTDAPSSDKLAEAKANALLIAAAPDLLAAVTTMRNVLRSAGYLTGVADDAIAKATGDAL